jgi:hypothetical protein
MPLTVSCRCGQLLAIQPEHVDKAVACPKCRAVVTVPAPAPSPPPADPPDEEIRLIPLEDGEELPELIPIDDEDGGSYQVQSEDQAGVNLAVSGDLGVIRLRADSIGCLAYGPDHRTGLAADEEKLFFLDLKARNGSPTGPMHGADIRCLALSADGQCALSGDARGGLLLWDVARRKPVRWLDGHRRELTSIAFAPGGRLAASADAGGILRLWDLGTGRVYPLPQAHCDEPLNCVCFSPDGRLVLAISEQGKARQWDLHTGQVGVRMEKGCSDLGSAAFGPDGTYALASSTAEYRVRRWDIRTGQRQRCFGGFAKRHPHIQGTFVCPNGRAIVAVGFSNEFRGRTRKDGALLAGGLAAGLVIVPALTVLAGGLTYGGLTTARAAQGDVTGQNYFLELWDVATEKAVQAVILGPNGPEALALAPDGHRVLATFGRGQVLLFAL